jgi:kinesin family protein 13
MTTPNAKEGLQAAGINSILPKEHGAKFYNLPIVKYCEKDVCAIASWDSSIHDSVNLNRVTPSNERVYMILKVVVRLSHPASMELVLRKRLSINIYKKQSMMDRMKKRMSKAVSLDFQFVFFLPCSLQGAKKTYEFPGDQVGSKKLH